MEKKIDDQRQKVEEMRNRLTDKSFNSSRNEISPNASIQERINNLQDISIACVKETLDYITLSNKQQESRLKMSPQDHEELVEFCTQLPAQVTEKLCEKSEKTRKNSLKEFIRKFWRLVFVRNN
ncbi:hypothetical protein TcasGA2_TC032742 [Tribolium castaneum]|uniref:Uncharacterized protein n=1 Tax=Tribolium castaneum TaxID=7070 RepID=A0A139WJ41_TRICA|nr:hypothetical protein TcasGA2_TC032742 [Tribolium castaneum]